MQPLLKQRVVFWEQTACIRLAAKDVVESTLGARSHLLPAPGDGGGGVIERLIGERELLTCFLIPSGLRLGH